MRALAAADILRLWETAHRYHPVDQALAMLMAAEPGRSRDELAALPLGRRDAGLLALRQATFGDSFGACSVCPRCREPLEFELSCSALQAPAEEARERESQIDAYRLHVRPLNSFDLAAAARAADTVASRRVLLEHCIVAVHRDGVRAEADALPEEVNAAIAQMAAAADPQAEIMFDLACPACGHRWQSVLDIAHILWAEIAAGAQRLLMEVHLLARSYGWCEADILAMSAARRAGYLQMVAP